MKKAATLVAGLLLVTGTVFAEGFTYDFSGTNVEFTQSLIDSQKGTLITKTGDSDVTVNFKLAKENTTVNFKAEFDDKDAVVVELGHKILDGVVEINVAGDLNFTGYKYDSDKKTYSQTQGLTASRNDSVWLKYAPKSVEGLEIKLFPYDLPFEVSMDDYKFENTTDIPGFQVAYKGFTGRVGSRQLADKSGDGVNRFYGQLSYSNSGESYGIDADLVFSTQDKNDKEWGVSKHKLPTAQKYAFLLKGNYKPTDVVKLSGEFLTGQPIGEAGKDDPKAGFALKARADYTLSEMETPEGTLTTSTYAQVMHFSEDAVKWDKDYKGDKAINKVEAGVTAEINSIKITPKLTYTTGDDVFEQFGKTEKTSSAYAAEITINYSI